MPNVIDIMKRLLPEGAAPGRGPNWSNPPFWPPDLYKPTHFLLPERGQIVSDQPTCDFRISRFFQLFSASGCSSLGGLELFVMRRSFARIRRIARKSLHITLLQPGGRQDWIQFSFNLILGSDNGERR